MVELKLNANGPNLTPSQHYADIEVILKHFAESQGEEYEESVNERKLNTASLEIMEPHVVGNTLMDVGSHIGSSALYFIRKGIVDQATLVDINQYAFELAGVATHFLDIEDNVQFMPADMRQPLLRSADTVLLSDATYRPPEEDHFIHGVSIEESATVLETLKPSIDERLLLGRTARQIRRLKPTIREDLTAAGFDIIHEDQVRAGPKQYALFVCNIK